VSIRLKTILGIALIEIVFLSLLLWLSLDALRTTNEDQLRGRAHSTAHLLGIAIKNALITNDLATLEALAREAVSHSHEREVQFDLERQGIGHFEEVHQVLILDPLGGVLIDSARQVGAGDEALPMPTLTSSTEGLIQAQMPVEQSGQIFGYVRVLLSAARIQDLIRSAEYQLYLIAGGELLLSTLFSILLGTWLVRGLKRLEEGVRRFGQGKWVELPCAGSDELARLTCTFNQMVYDLATQRQRAEALQLVAQTDHLTGLLNRQALLPALSRMMAEAERDQTLLAVAYLDLDGFKPINDRLGHEVGDVVLQEVARRLRQTFRHHDLVFRVGGDEFVLCIGDLTTVETGLQLLERVLVNLRAPIRHEGQPLPPLGASLGLVAYPWGGPASPEALMACADQAMYAAKRAGGNRVLLHEPSLGAPTDVLGARGSAPDGP
jgi:diguanylate cyclase (GGDEF)-like protein